MPQAVPWILLALVEVLVIVPHVSPAVAIAVSPATTPPQPPGCHSKCGEVDIPYPFAIGDDNCSWHGMFSLTCNHSFSPPRPYVGGNVEIINISVETGEMQVYTEVSSICYDSPNTGNFTEVSLNLAGTPFLISPTRNVFTAIGCNTLALLLNGREDTRISFYTGCITSCTSVEGAAEDRERCTGLGCCQTPVPDNLAMIQVDWNNGSDTINPAWSYSPCSYAFISAESWYHFKREDLRREGNESFINRVGDRTIPMVLDWAITDGSCLSTTVDGRKPTAPACASANSYCVNATQRHDAGYLCNCYNGYQGNPYITDGCTAPLSSLALACLAIVLVHRRMLYKRFNKNGGKVLTKLGIQTFTKAELNKITNRFKNPIGKGAYGKVYKGIIGGNQHVAVKRAYAKGKELHQEEFTNEITVLLRLNRHTNVVRLVGCCLETDVPMLVFEFVPKGSLYDILYGSVERAVSDTMPLSKRLGIAIGSAAALTYMHMHTPDGHENENIDMHGGSHDHNINMNNGSHNHVHGDVKSANILLDDDLQPKISDFGSSKLLTIGYARSVAADMSYVDPVFMKTGRFTVKSDVYSFGVVLLELITRKKVLYGDNSLPIEFVKSCKKEGNGRSMYDAELLSDDVHAHRYMECLDRIAVLAVQCLKEDQDDRPAMADVLKELKHARDIAFRNSCSDKASSSIHMDEAGNQTSMHHGQTTS